MRSVRLLEGMCEMMVVRVVSLEMGRGALMNQVGRGDGAVTEREEPKMTPRSLVWAAPSSEMGKMQVVVMGLLREKGSRSVFWLWRFRMPLRPLQLEMSGGQLDIHNLVLS